MKVEESISSAANMEEPRNIKLYGSFYIHHNSTKSLLSIIWLLPHDIRRTLFKKIFPKQYWRVLGYRRNLENGFYHPEKTHLYYSISKFHENKSIYVHIPKCGGISIASSLFGHCVPHSTITDYQIMFGSQIFNSYFKFTIVRNPWDRLVSAYFFLKNGGFDSTDRKIYTPIIQQWSSFGEFVKSIYFNRGYIQWTHLLPQHYWIKTPSGKIPIDYIGKLENLDQSLNHICDRIGIPPPIIEKKNSSPRPHENYRNYYTNETKLMVAELYKEDISLLGYKF